MTEINCDPEMWGKHLWYFMEAIACTLNENNKNTIYNFFELLKDIIPCQECKKHYIEYFNKNNLQLYLKNSLTLIEWLYHLKIDIKKRQNKELPSFSEYYNHIIEYYDVPELYDYIEEIISEIKEN